MIEDLIREGKRECELLIPYSEQSIVSSLYNTSEVLSVDYEERGVLVKAILGNEEQGMLAKYIIK